MRGARFLIGGACLTPLANLGLWDFASDRSAAKSRQVSFKGSCILCPTTVSWGQTPLELIPPAARAELPEALESRIRAFIARFSPSGANYLEWEAIASPDLATDPPPVIDAYNRLFML